MVLVSDPQLSAFEDRVTNHFQMHTHTLKAAVSKTPATPSGAPSTKSVGSSTKSLPANGFGSPRLDGLSADLTMAKESPASRMLKLSGSKSLVLPLSRFTFSGMSTRTTKLRLALVSLIVTERPSMINRAVNGIDGNDEKAHPSTLV